MSRKHHKQRKTKKAKAKSGRHVMTIPELRRAFEHVETFVETHSKMPKKELIEAFQEEWRKTFKKEVDTASAEAYVDHALHEVAHKDPRHRRHHGGAYQLEGAPILQDTRPGVYIVPGVNEHSYAQVPAYVDKGFQNPEQARDYDPVMGQPHYVTRTPIGMGSNQAGGRRTRKRKQEGGNLMSTISQFLFRPPMAAEPPSNPMNDAVSYGMALPLPPSPDASQRHPQYKSSS